MLKKTVLTLVVGVGLAASIPASSIDLSLFDSDFDKMLTGLAQDLAPTLRLGALSGDLQGDATIDHVSVTFPALGVVLGDGLGRNLRRGVTNWEFPVKMDKLIGDLGDTSYQKTMIYPSLKFGLGLGWNKWDVTASGMWLPQGIADTLTGLGPKLVKDLKPQLSFGNIGLQVRRTLINDSGWTVPAVSLGTGLSMTGFNIATQFNGLADLGAPTQSAGPNQEFDLRGNFGLTTTSTVFTVDLQASKRLTIFTPYLKLSGAYQNTTVKGDADLIAKIHNTTDSSLDSSQSITSHPVVNVSDFAIITTTGLELNLFGFVTNFNMVADLSRAFLNVHSFSLAGIDANAVSFNTGFRYAF